MEKDELNDLLREVCRDEILKDARPTLTTLKALHADRPLLVLALSQAIDAITELTVAADQSPLDVVLWCPRCFEQHIDEAKPDVCEECGLDEDLCTAKGDTFRPWLNPPHKSHRCGNCNHVWRPADGPTNGVPQLAKQGERDGSAKPVAFASGKDFDDAVQIATAREALEHYADPKRWTTKSGSSYGDRVRDKYWGNNGGDHGYEHAAKALADINPNGDAKSLDDQIASGTKSWDSVDTDKFIDNLRGRQG